MSVDKFGRHSASSKFEVVRGPPGEGFHLTNDGDYNILNKRLCNVADPRLSSDAVNVQYIKDNTLVLNKDGLAANNHFIRRLKFPEEESDAVNNIYVDKKLHSLRRECCDFQDFRLINIKDPVDSKDAVNKQAMLKILKQYKQDLE